MRSSDKNTDWILKPLPKVVFSFDLAGLKKTLERIEEAVCSLRSQESGTQEPDAPETRTLGKEIAESLPISDGTEYPESSHSGASNVQYRRARDVNDRRIILLSGQEAADYAQVSLSTVRQWVTRGLISTRSHGRYRYDKASIEKYLSTGKPQGRTAAQRGTQRGPRPKKKNQKTN